jgi:hypothetical protein
MAALRKTTPTPEGINLGPAVTFGYIAGRHIAGASGWE